MRVLARRPERNWEERRKGEEGRWQRSDWRMVEPYEPLTTKKVKDRPRVESVPSETSEISLGCPQNRRTTPITRPRTSTWSVKMGASVGWEGCRRQRAPSW